MWTFIVKWYQNPAQSIDVMGFGPDQYKAAWAKCKVYCGHMPILVKATYTAN